MLTQEGKEAACECITRSGLPDSSNDAFSSERIYDLGTNDASDLEIVRPHSDIEVTASSVDLRRKKPKVIPPDYTERV